ncbi:MAG TPA: hypothetical protein PKE39_15100 [Ignavibacteria bacterium]|nr:hypothetical protein [Ignavibacteria bacterium]HMR00348.1 hypothetical protein [Ignavibacteria bacterium]
MKTLLALIIAMILTRSNFTQEYPNEDFYLNSTNDLYSLNYLNTQSSGMGFTGIARLNDISGIENNPASINIPSKYQLNFQYTFKGKHALNYSFTSDNIALKHQLFSGSAGIGWKINKNLTTGLIYNNPKGYYYDLGEGVRTDEFGNVISRYDFYINTVMHSVNIPFVYASDKFRIGLNANYIYGMFSVPGEGFTTINYPNGFEDGNDFKGSTSWFKLDGGVLLHLSKQFAAGLSVSTSMKSTVTYSYPDGTEDHAMASIPWKGGIGFLYSIPGSSWKIGADYKYERTSVITYYKDRHNLHFGTEGIISKNWILRAGFFTLFDNRKDEGNLHWSDKVGAYDQYFVTFGGSYILKNTKINLAVLTSQLSAGKYQNFLVNAGVTFDF